jgi:hypothetical protein
MEVPLYGRKACTYARLWDEQACICVHLRGEQARRCVRLWVKQPRLGGKADGCKFTTTYGRIIPRKFSMLPLVSYFF